MTNETIAFMEALKLPANTVGMYVTKGPASSFQLRAVVARDATLPTYGVPVFTGGKHAVEGVKTYLWSVAGHIIHSNQSAAGI